MLVEPRHNNRIDDYAAVASLANAVEALRTEAHTAAASLSGRRVWMVNSTAQGGGVAEMLAGQVGMLRDLGIQAQWWVLESDHAAFFRLTKSIHNLIHGAGAPHFTAADRELYEAVNRSNAETLVRELRAGDIVVVHDPQPMAMAAHLRAHADVRTIWRCHIGLDEENDATRSAWSFLEPYAAAYERAVFSAPEYIPEWFADRAVIIHPGIDPLSPKNRELHLHKIVGVLANSALLAPPGPVVRAPFPRLARRLQRDRTFGPAMLPEDIGLLSRPIVTQVSRWDRLKGFLPLMQGFAQLKEDVWARRGGDGPDARRRLSLARLVLAGPDPHSVQDDPEAQEVLEELAGAYAQLDPMTQDDVVLVTLPMEYPEHNALMVNALQRASSIVAQNSLREGFGLTVTEAMWKRLPVLTNSRSCGPRHQVRDGVEGRLARDPEDPVELAALIREMLGDTEARKAWGRAAQRRVHDEFLVFSQVRSWLRLLDELTREPPRAAGSSA